MSPRIRPPPPNTSASIPAASRPASRLQAIRSCMPVAMPTRNRGPGAAAFHVPSTGVHPMPADDRGPLDKLADCLPKTSVMKWVAANILVPFWAWRTPVAKLPGGPPYSVQPGDNVQRMMNLIMPLKDKSAIGRALAALAIAQNKDEIYAGLDNVGTVHFARFVIVDNNICMFSVYDGDFANYIRDFIATIGSVFDAVVELVEEGDKVIPSESNIEKFIDWVHDHDMYQVPDDATGILRNQEALLLSLIHISEP